MPSDGSPLKRRRPRILDRYQTEICELWEKTQNYAQTLRCLEQRHPDTHFVRRTLVIYIEELRSKVAVASDNVVRARSPLLDPFAPIIEEMQEGGATTRSIFEHLQTLGYKGSYGLLAQTFPRYIYRRKIPLQKRITVPAIVHRIWTWRDKEEDKGQDQKLEMRLQEQSPVYSLLKAIFTTFRDAFTAKDEERLRSWLKANASSEYPPLQRFVNGINKDIDAVMNALRYPWSNGLLEGMISKLKMVKRTMYGRAHFDLIRAKLMLASAYATAF